MSISVAPVVHGNVSAPPEADSVVGGKFGSWRDNVATPLVLLSILALSGSVTALLASVVGMELFAKALVFFVASTSITMALVRIVATAFLRRPGVYSRRRHVGTCYAWNLIGFLGNTLLWFEVSSGMLPTMLRQLFYNLLGAKIGPGVVVVAGKIVDPWLVEIGADATVGEGAFLCPHVMTSSETLMLDRIRIGRGAVVGAHSVVMAGSTIGEGALVNAMSLLPVNTQVGAYEVWGGNPARKIGEMTRPRSFVSKRA